MIYRIPSRLLSLSLLLSIFQQHLFLPWGKWIKEREKRGIWLLNMCSILILPLLSVWMGYYGGIHMLYRLFFHFGCLLALHWSLPNTIWDKEQNSLLIITVFYHLSLWQPTQPLVLKRTEKISISLHLKLKTMSLPVRLVTLFFCMIGFKLKVQWFSQGELFEIVMMRGICHLVTDLVDMLQG